MIYNLKDCRDGSEAVYDTTVEITKQGSYVSFKFVAMNTTYNCPHNFYNGIHSEADACEILIGTDPERRVYYEMEISAMGDLMLAKMTNSGDDNGEPILDIGFVDVPFIKGDIVRKPSGYEATISFDLADINTGDGEVYFNAYRLETDGEYRDKHLFALIPTLRPKFHVPERFVYLNDYL